MDSSKISVKFFVRDASGLHPDSFVPVFHRWIQTHALPGHQLVDVADYKHVPDGPGTVLVAHEANLLTDSSHGKLGLLYLRKTPIEGDLSQRLRLVFRDALFACKKLEEEPALAGKIFFRTDEVQIRIHDRLNAPNSAKTFNEVKPAVETFLRNLYGSPVTLTHDPNEETLFEITAKTNSTASVSDLLSRIG